MIQKSIEPLKANQAITLEIGGIPILVCNHDGQHYAIENRCSHQDNPLQGGRIRNGHIACPLHGVRFCLITGESKGQLTRRPIRTFNVQNSPEGPVISVPEQD